MDNKRDTLEQLDKYIICPNCNILHKKVDIPYGKKALCTNCEHLLYRVDPAYIDKGLALSIAALILFIVANLFPIIKIDYYGNSQQVVIYEAIKILAESGFYLVAFTVVLMILVVPLFIILDYLLLMILMKTKKGKNETKRLLKTISILLPWSMADIFLVSILVALIKLAEEVQIYFGVSFWALVLYILLEMYLLKHKTLGYLWELRHAIYGE